VERHLEAGIADIDKDDVDGVLFRQVGLVDAVRQGGGGGFRHEAQAVDSSYLRGIQHGSPLLHTARPRLEVSLGGDGWRLVSSHPLEGRAPPLRPGFWDAEWRVCVLSGK